MENQLLTTTPSHTHDTTIIGATQPYERRGQIPLETMKHQERLAAIRTRLKASLQVNLKTSVCARHIRRDFNIASAKMYVFCLNRKFAREVANALEDMDFSLALLASDTAKYAYVSTECLASNKYDLDIVSPESAQMMRTLRTADAYLSKLYAAELTGVIDKVTRREIMKPFWMSYAAFKRIAMQIKGKSIEEMLAEVEMG